MLLRAFEGEPFFAWMFPDDRVRAQAMPLGFKSEFASCAQGEVWAEVGGAGLSLWMPPGRERISNTPSEAELLRTIRRAGGLWHLARVFWGLGRLHRVRPRVPFCHLVMLAVEPAHQSRGLGAALLQPMLARCDEQKVLAVAETTNERALAFYARQGFAVRHEVLLPRGPRVWCLWREPQEPQSQQS
jgi:GNAT superfamily N-acetyltransferase